MQPAQQNCPRQRRHPYRHPLFLTLPALLVTIALAAPLAAASPALTFTELGAQVSELKPGAQVAWLFAGRAYGSYVSRVGASFGVAVDRDTDGVVQLDLGHQRPQHSLWAVVDLETGALLLTQPAGAKVEFEELALRGSLEAGAGGLPNRLRLPGFRYQALWVRPGEGAWSTLLSDGGSEDADGVQDGQLTLALDTMQAVETTPSSGEASAAPDQLQPGDLILLFDAERLRGLSAEVKADDLRTVSTNLTAGR
jgi:hypothetical protein